MGELGRPIGERVAAVEEQLEYLERETLRTRQRLHELESDRATLRLLVEHAKGQDTRISDIVNSMEAVSQRTAEKTVALAFADQTQIKEVRDDRRRDRFRTALSVGSFGVAAGGFIAAIVFQLTS